MGRLGKELLDGVFAAEEDGAGVDVPVYDFNKIITKEIEEDSEGNGMVWGHTS